MQTKYIYYIIFVLMVLIDQYSKHFISDMLSLDEFIKVNNFFNLTYIKNDGAAFSLLSNGGYLQRYFLLFVAINPASP